MKSIWIASVALMALCSASCSKDDDSFPFDETYLPLAVGNYWEFVPLGLPSGDVIEHREVMAKAKLNGHEYYLIVSDRPSFEGRYLDSIYYRVEGDGYVYIYRKNSTDESQDFRLKGKDGDTWTYNYFNQETRITLTETTVDLSSGPIPNAKNYYRDTIQAADEEYTITLLPGLGFVKEFSNAWGSGKILKSARISGVVKTF